MTVPEDLEFIHRFIPAPAPEPPLTLLLLHGTGGNEQDLISIGRQLSPDAALLSPRGKVLENGMPRFFRRIAEGVFDLEDLKLQTANLARFIREAARQYALEESRFIAVGYSNGANIAASLLLSHPGVLAGAILFRPMVPFIPETPPNLHSIPVFLAAGRQDPIVPAAQTSALASLLESAGALVSTHWYSGGHELSHDDLAAAKAWLSRTLPRAG